MHEGHMRRVKRQDLYSLGCKVDVDVIYNILENLKDTSKRARLYGLEMHAHTATVFFIYV